MDKTQQDYEDFHFFKTEIDKLICLLLNQLPDLKHLDITKRIEKRSVNNIVQLVQTVIPSSVVPISLLEAMVNEPPDLLSEEETSERMNVARIKMRHKPDVIGENEELEQSEEDEKEPEEVTYNQYKNAFMQEKYWQPPFDLYWKDVDSLTHGTLLEDILKATSPATEPQLDELHTLLSRYQIESLKRNLIAVASYCFRKRWESNEEVLQFNPLLHPSLLELISGAQGYFGEICSGSESRTSILQGRVNFSLPDSMNFALIYNHEQIASGNTDLLPYQVSVRRAVDTPST